MTEARRSAPAPGRGPGFFPGGRGGVGFSPPMGRAMEKAKDFKGTLKRLAVYLRPRGLRLLAVLCMAILSVAFNILGPKIMGKATTKLFEGLMLKLRGVPGAGVDFGYLGHILALLVGLYLLSAFFSYLQQFIMAGVAQKTVFDLRRDVEAKLNRLPLKFFDGRTHGEILSRVTNDIDNVSTTLQQSLTQLITALVTVVGVVVMMLTISPR